jgi:hypothetical protein
VQRDQRAAVDKGREPGQKSAAGTQRSEVKQVPGSQSLVLPLARPTHAHTHTARGLNFRFRRGGWVMDVAGDHPSRIALVLVRKLFSSRFSRTEACVALRWRAAFTLFLLRKRLAVRGRLNFLWSRSRGFSSIAATLR